MARSIGFASLRRVWEQKKTQQPPRFPTLDRDLQVDVCIVGGGISGLSIAYALAKEGEGGELEASLVIYIGYIACNVCGRPTLLLWRVYGSTSNCPKRRDRLVHRRRPRTFSLPASELQMQPQYCQP